MLRAPRTAHYGRTDMVDVKSISSYCHYLMMKGQLSGNFCFDGHLPSKEEDSVAEQCSRICDRIANSLDICPINEIPELLDYYDIAYRIGNKCLPDKTIIGKHKHRVFNAWNAGDRTIEESAVYGMIMPEVAYHPESADRQYYVAYHTLKDKWILTLKRYDYFPEVTTYENYLRLALMMRENIDGECGDKSESIKRRWYDHNRIDDFSKVSTAILRSYRRFASSLFPAVFDYETQLNLDNRILSELSTRTDLNPHDREAFAMALLYNSQMA